MFLLHTKNNLLKWSDSFSDGHLQEIYSKWVEIYSKMWIKWGVKGQITLDSFQKYRLTILMVVWFMGFKIIMWCDLGKSVWSRTCDIFSFLLNLIAHLGTFCWKPHLNRSSGSKVMSNWRIRKTIKNKRNSLLCSGYISQWCSRLPTDSARLQHIPHLTWYN